MIALSELVGVGVPGKCWEEMPGHVFHMRRLLTSEEQEQAGELRDIRGTAEAIMRFRTVRPMLPPPALAIALDEIMQPTDREPDANFGMSEAEREALTQGRFHSLATP